MTLVRNTGELEQSKNLCCFMHSVSSQVCLHNFQHSFPKRLFVFAHTASAEMQSENVTYVCMRYMVVLNYSLNSFLFSFPEAISVSIVKSSPHQNLR